MPVLVVFMVYWDVSHWLIPVSIVQFYYSLSDIDISGRCRCAGHARSCQPRQLTAEELASTMSTCTSQRFCECEHNTCGVGCGECCPGFQQVKWRPATDIDPFECEGEPGGDDSFRIIQTEWSKWLALWSVAIACLWKQLVVKICPNNRCIFYTLAWLVAPSVHLKFYLLMVTTATQPATFEFCCCSLPVLWPLIDVQVQWDCEQAGAQWRHSWTYARRRCLSWLPGKTAHY